MHVDKTGLIMPESRTHSLESGWRERAQQGAGLHEPNSSDGGGCGSVGSDDGFCGSVSSDGVGCNSVGSDGSCGGSDGSDGSGCGMPSALRSAAAASRSDICGT